MAQYIDKSALVAEIENLENNYQKYPTSYEEGLKDGRLIGYKDALNKINTLKVKEVQEEPVSEDFEEAAENYASTGEVLPNGKVIIDFQAEKAFRAGAKWQKNNLWKSADGDELPEIDKEVVAFQETFPTDVDVPSLLKIVIAHRPNPEGYDGKSITTEQVEHYTPKTYGKGGWNIPDVKYWLDVELPKEIEL